jgi:hypothetical protein
MAPLLAEGVQDPVATLQWLPSPYCRCRLSSTGTLPLPSLWWHVLCQGSERVPPGTWPPPRACSVRLPDKRFAG